MEELRGFKQCKKDLLESYDKFYQNVKRFQKSDKLEAKLPVVKRCPMMFRVKPGSGLGWTEPRMEAFIGCVDKRLSLKGYIGGVKKRESKFFNV